MPVTLEPLLHHLPAWMLVLFRLTGLFLMAPIFSSPAILARVKIFLAVGLSFCVYPVLLEPAHMPWAADAEAILRIHQILHHGLSFWTLVPVILAELMIGFVIGFGAMIPIYGVQLGARMVDQQMGLGLAEVFNPEIGDNSGILDQIYFVLAMMIFLILGGHRVLLDVLVGTFQTVPLGAYSPTGSTLNLFAGLLASMMDLAFRVAGPLLCLAFLQTVAMGFIARTVPQMNILSIGFPLRIITGGLILVVSLRAEAEVIKQFMGGALRDLSRYFT